MEQVGSFGWADLQRDKILEVAGKLAESEKLTWHEILVTSKTRNHSVLVSKLCPEAKKRLTEILQDDIDEVVSLRLSGRERVWGIRQAGVFKVLWWDPKHEVCPSLRD